MLRPVHFEIMVPDPQRAEAFYKAVFDWKFEKWEGGAEDYWLITSGDKETPGINGGMAKSMGPGPDGVTINTMDVDDVDVYVQKVVDSGGTLAMPKTHIPGVGYVAYCKDTEGILFGLFQGETPEG